MILGSDLIRLHMHSRSLHRLCITLPVLLAALAPIVARSDSAVGSAPISTNGIAQLPPVTVADTPLMSEAQPVGPSGQPEWTTVRRFSTTRVYVQQPPGGFAFEQWWRDRFLGGGDEQHLFQEEIEIGLPHRLQLDLYENWVLNEHGTIKHDNFAVERRWALADWRHLPLNPTIYGERWPCDEATGLHG
jgi:hypothetical protein